MYGNTRSGIVLWQLFDPIRKIEKNIYLKREPGKGEEKRQGKQNEPGILTAGVGLRDLWAEVLYNWCLKCRDMAWWVL